MGLGQDPSLEELQVLVEVDRSDPFLQLEMLIDRSERRVSCLGLLAYPCLD